MTNPYRAMCAELLLFSEEAGEICMNESLWPKSDPTCTLQQRARALLAHPTPQPPADGEVAKLVEWLQDCANVRNDEGYTSLGYQYFRAAELLARPTPQPPADGEVAELQRWGVDHGAQPGRPLLSPMEDGYWTPWHIAADLLQRLASDNAGLEAAAESAYLDNLSLLDSQND